MATVSKDKFIGVLRTPQMQTEIASMGDYIGLLQKGTQRIQNMHEQMVKPND